MAHEFESGMFIGKAAWHRLGVTLDEFDPARSNVELAMKTSGLDWDVSKEPIFVASAAGGFSVVDSHKAVVRSKDRKVLGVVGNQYQPLQNSQQFEWFQPFLDTKECYFESCGSLKGGSVVWVLAKLCRDDADVGGGDKIRKYLLLTTSHDGSLITRVGFTPTRVVCWNTLSIAINRHDSQLLRVRHTIGQAKALKEIRGIINTVDETFEATAAEYKKLAKCKISRSDLRRYVKLVLELPEDDKAMTTGQKNRLQDVIDLCVKGNGNDGKSVWSAYNGITEHLTHYRGLTNETRLRSLWYGNSRIVNDRALKLAIEFAS